MLITAGVYSTEASRNVQKLFNRGLTIPQVMGATGLGRASVNGYLPYSKRAYKLDDPSTAVFTGRESYAGPGWRYTDYGHPLTDFYKKVREVFNLDEVDARLKAQEGE